MICKIRCLQQQFSEWKKAGSEPRLEDVCVFPSSARRAGWSSDTAIARDIWEETEGAKDTGFSYALGLHF